METLGPRARAAFHSRQQRLAHDDALVYDVRTKDTDAHILETTAEGAASVPQESDYVWHALLAQGSAVSASGRPQRWVASADISDEDSATSDECRSLLRAVAEKQTPAAGKRQNCLAVDINRAAPALADFSYLILRLGIIAAAVFVVALVALSVAVARGPHSAAHAGVDEAARKAAGACTVTVQGYDVSGHDMGVAYGVRSAVACCWACHAHVAATATNLKCSFGVWDDSGTGACYFKSAGGVVHGHHLSNLWIASDEASNPVPLEVRRA